MLDWVSRSEHLGSVDQEKINTYRYTDKQETESNYYNMQQSRLQAKYLQFGLALVKPRSLRNDRTVVMISRTLHTSACVSSS